MENNFDEIDDISGIAERKRKIVRQIQTVEKELFRQWKNNLILLVKNIIHFPYFLYNYFTSWKECIVNDFIDTI